MRPAFQAGPQLALTTVPTAVRAGARAAPFQPSPPSSAARARPTPPQFHSLATGEPVLATASSGLYPLIHGEAGGLDGSLPAPPPAVAIHSGSFLISPVGSFAVRVQGWAAHGLPSMGPEHCCCRAFRRVPTRLHCGLRRSARRSWRGGRSQWCGRRGRGAGSHAWQHAGPARTLTSRAARPACAAHQATQAQSLLEAISRSNSGMSQLSGQGRPSNVSSPHAGADSSSPPSWSAPAPALARFSG